jgi:hypothetical protein
MVSQILDLGELWLKVRLGQSIIRDPKKYYKILFNSVNKNLMQAIVLTISCCLQFFTLLAKPYRINLRLTDGYYQILNDRSHLMKRNFVLLAFVVALAISASAQKTTDFSGTWTLDIAKSRLDERSKASIESQTITVTQTATQLKVETATKRKAPPAGAPAGGPPPGGMGGGRPGGMGGGMGAMMGGDGTVSYSLEKETSSEIQGPMGAMTVVTKAKIDGGKLLVTRITQTPMGDRTITEAWSLGADGRTLNVEVQRPNRDGGTDTTTKVFIKG